MPTRHKSRGRMAWAIDPDHAAQRATLAADLLALRNAHEAGDVTEVRYHIDLGKWADRARKLKFYLRDFEQESAHV